MKLITNETPVKVLSLLGLAVTSMFFLFAVTVTNASFEQTENPFPVAFAPEQVVAVLDSTANSYSAFLQENLFSPAKKDFAMYADTASFIAENSAPQILHYAGLEGISNYGRGEQVAGASTERVVSKYYPSEGGAFGLFFAHSSTQ